MVWARILVPFESSLNEEDVYYSAKLSCLEMIKSGTTTFADSGGVHMHKGRRGRHRKRNEGSDCQVNNGHGSIHPYIYERLS